MTLRTIGIILVVLGVLDLLIGHRIAGSWIYAIILIAFGASLLIKSRKK